MVVLMSDKKFLIKIGEAFYKYLDTDSGSNEKLKILHGFIASDLKSRLGDNFEIHSLGYGDGKEYSVKGKYMDKKVDIAVLKDGEILAAFGLKFIMRNYKQNSNNYFENMLGETANIRLNGIPYFQIIIMPSTVPYFDKYKKITRPDILTSHNLSKYINLSNDDVNKYIHIPNKTLIYIVDIPGYPETVKDFSQYINYYKNIDNFVVSKNKGLHEFGDSFVYNDYDGFIQEIVDLILSM